jgi:hypothetical protein
MKSDQAEYLRRVEECVARSQVRREGRREGRREEGQEGGREEQTGVSHATH